MNTAQSTGAVESTHCISVNRQVSLNVCFAYEMKSADCEAPAMGLWGMWSTLSFSLLPSPVIAHDRVLAMCQIELFNIEND